MKEYLFRAKRVDNGKWVCGNLIDNECHKKPIIVEVDYLNEYGDFGEVSYEVDKKSVSQCCGLTDKNGKKIFEGDCIGCRYNVVEYVDGTFTINGDRPLSWFIGTKDFVLIGNIHDNPELLKE